MVAVIDVEGPRQIAHSCPPKRCQPELDRLHIVAQYADILDFDLAHIAVLQPGRTGGEPQEMTSPGLSVPICDRNDTICSGVNNRSEVEWLCRTSPLTRHLMCRLLGSMSVTMQGPMGAKPS